MRLPRIAVLVLALGLAPIGIGWAQTDPLQDANQLFRQGQFDRAMDRVNSYLSSRPKDARGRFLKGLILTEQNKPNEAIKVFTDLSQDYPELPEPYNNLAVLYASQGAYDKARNALEMAIRTHPSYATAHENLGDIYAKMASQAYDKALQIDKSNSAAQTKLRLIKELFTSSTRATRPPASKTESSTTGVAVAAVKPSPAAPPVAPALQQTLPQVAAQAPAATAKPAEPARATEPVKPASSDVTGEVIKPVNSWAKAW